MKFEDAIESITNNGEYIAFIMLNAVAINLSLMLLFMIIKKKGVEMKRILVAGATGYLGGFLVQELKTRILGTCFS